jgi:predicted transcriptional regulator
LSEAAKQDPERRARIETQKQALVDALALSQLRESRHLTQQQLADELNVSQANISRLERQDDLYLSTLSRYVEALGGRLEVVAVFDDEVVHLNQQAS